MSTKDPCKPYACKIQVCLRENKFQEDACRIVIEDMRNCCKKWKDRSYVCEGIDTKEKSKTDNERH